MQFGMQDRFKRDKNYGSQTIWSIIWFGVAVCRQIAIDKHTQFCNRFR